MASFRIAAITLISVFFAISISGAAFAATPVSSCGTISSSGSYALTSNILNDASSTCFTISANNVVFDCQGHTIDGTDAGVSKGFSLSGRSNVTIANCVITDFGHGILLQSSSNNNVLTSNTASSNSISILLSASSSNTITNNTVSSDSNLGIGLFSGSNGNTITNNTVSSEFQGIRFDFSSSNTISNNTANSNGVGITLTSSSNNLIYNNIFNNSANVDIDSFPNFWNTTKQAGTNIIGGPFLGGNFWANPAVPGFSQTCPNVIDPTEAICDDPLVFNSANTDFLPLFGAAGPDTDGDGVQDNRDNCPGTPPGSVVDANGCLQAQVDQDLDGKCDPGKSSTFCTGSDNCPTVSNPDQLDSDSVLTNLNIILNDANSYTDTVEPVVTISRLGSEFDPELAGSNFVFSCGTCETATFQDATSQISAFSSFCGYDWDTLIQIVLNDNKMCGQSTTSGTKYDIDLLTWTQYGMCFDIDGGASCAAAGGEISYLRSGLGSDGIGDACDCQADGLCTAQSFCAGASTPDSDCGVSAICGNSIVEVGEQCDGGNTVSGDCCSSTCQNEPAGSQTCGVGACQVTTAACSNGSPVTCTPGTPSAETCNGVDDNCNGLVDDGVDTDSDGFNDCTQDACLGLAGQFQGCPVADKNIVSLHTVDLGGGASTKAPLTGAEVRVFDRNSQAFQAVAGSKNPDGSLYGVIFEADAGRIAACMTDSMGICYAGEPSVGDYLVVVKYYDSSTGKTVYTGKPKSPADFVGNVATKDFQIIKVLRKGVFQEYRGGSKIVVTGSYLEMILPESAVWEGMSSVYPFIFISDSDWSVDLCAQVPSGYRIEGVYDDYGNLVTSKDCVQTFVNGETKVVAFAVSDVGSPEPSFGAKITTKHNGKTTKNDVKINDLRKPAFDAKVGEAKAKLKAAGRGKVSITGKLTEDEDRWIRGAILVVLLLAMALYPVGRAKRK